MKYKVGDYFWRLKMNKTETLLLNNLNYGLEKIYQTITFEYEDEEDETEKYVREFEAIEARVLEYLEDHGGKE